MEIGGGFAPKEGASAHGRAAAGAHTLHHADRGDGTLGSLLVLIGATPIMLFAAR